MRTQSRSKIAQYKGIQGRAWAVWSVWSFEDFTQTYEVEMVWGGNGVVFRAETMEEVEEYMTKVMAKRVW